MKNLLEKLFILFLSSLLGAFLLQTLYSWQTEIRDPEEDWLRRQRDRKASLDTICQKYTFSKGKPNPQVASQIFVDERHNFIYCEVPKVGCSNWKKIILLLTLNLSRDVLEVDHDRVHRTHLLRRLSSYPSDQQVKLLNSSIKVMFTRHPLERLVSAYRDKLLHFEPFYVSVAKRIKTLFRGNPNSTDPVTFQEFVNFVLKQAPNDLDIHWKPMFMLCDPCNIHYDILGKYETLGEDADHVLRRIGAPDDLQYPDFKKYGTEKRTNNNITLNHFSKLSKDQVQKLKDLYSIDFSSFNYSFHF
ncbi:carbohydrate sulfotransferase 8-like [Podarcis raffonei]|uniref:carbohydrate sulfotransferase 8-like n=1 Tax=Podarcis raffonei TaxID=65483 RepID=UPI00232935B7|nr:carbohydrate sulfotransferase 8-like [Podarcis raffonei]